MQLVIGRIGKAHGISGEVSVEVRTDDPDRRFTAGTQIDTEPADRGPLTILGARPHSGRLLIRFAEVEDRTAAEALRGTLLVADSSTTPPSEDPEEFWDHDIVGLAVVTTTGERIGAVTEIVHVPGQDLLSVTRDSGEELLVPFVAAMVPTVDVAGGRVVIDPPPGLLAELAEAED